MSKKICAPRGTKRSCKGWEQEAALRMLMNNLDPDVAEDSDNLVVYCSNAKAVRSWEDFDLVTETLKSLRNDETLVVQSGKPVGVFETFEYAPRVLIVNGFIVPKYASFEKFTELEAKGLTMFGGFTAGSWIYIGAQGIIQGTYETFAAAQQALNLPSLKGKLILTSGLGGMGRAQPLAITMNEAVGIIVEVNREKIERCIKEKFLDTWTEDLDEAIKMADQAKQKGNPLSIGLLGNTADIYPEFVRRNIVPTIVTDQTSAHDELHGYVPSGISYEGALELRRTDPDRYTKMSLESIVKHAQAMKDLRDMGAETFEYGNWIRAQAKKAGLEGAQEFFPGFIEAYIRTLFCQGRGPFRWVALSGDPEDIYRTDNAVAKTFPRVQRWIKMAQDRVPFQGLPARTCWLGHGERTEAGLLFNELVKTGEVKAPIVFGRDHLDCGSVASPSKQTGNMKDGSDVIGDWPILKALLNVATGASWVSVHQMWDHMFSSGMVIVADGTKRAEKKLKKALTGDTGLGVASLVDAGYEVAIQTARDKKIRIPHLE
jgi:urocanate hydratase